MALITPPPTNWEAYVEFTPAIYAKASDILCHMYDIETNVTYQDIH